MAGKRVAVLTPDGQFGTVDEADVQNLPDGARVLSKQEVTERKLEEEYAAKSTGLKVAEALGGKGLGPTHEAFLEAGRSAFSGGISQAATRRALDTAGPAGAGKQYAEHLGELEEGKPGATTAGTVAGIAGGVAVGMAGGGAPGAGAARLLPMNAIATAGAPVEAGVARALGGLASRGAIGKAATTAASMAARGVAEGAVYSGVEATANSITHDTPLTGEKLYGAMGHGALVGGGLGTTLGFTGSLVASGVRRAASRIGQRSAIAESPIALPSIDADAGLREAAPFGGSPFGIGEGAERRPIQLRPGGRVRINPDEPFSIGNEPTTSLRDLPLSDINPIEPYSPFKLEAARKDIASGNAKPVRAFLGEGGRYDLTDGIHKTAAAREAGLESISARVTDGFPISFDPDAGLAARGAASEPAFRVSSAKNVPRETTLKLGDEFAPIESRAPIKLPKSAEPPLKGIDGVLSDPSNLLRGYSADQAWKAMGAGFGLQTTRYAKVAQAHFPNGTTDLGEMALRHGVLETSATGGLMKAAFDGAKNNTPIEMFSRATDAVEKVGKRIGEITDASGARITQKQILGAIREVANEYGSTAATRPVARSIQNYGAELVDSLRLAEKGSTASVQDVLLERKALDRLVFGDNPTLDPKMMLAAKRALRNKLEDVITESLDAASGKVPGELKAEYKALKKDYHGLRVIEDLLEDSAARASKAATLGLGEKFAVGTALATGNITAAPVLAVGGKLLRERGNAAAAAFLKRAADLGTFEAIVQKFNMKMQKSAAGVLKEVPRSETTSASKTSAELRTTAEESKKAIAAKKEKAQSIMQWLADFRTDPTTVLSKVQESAESISRSAGPKAAESFTASSMRAISFIAAHVPIKERRDPLDPRSTPPLTHAESERLVRAAKYALKPDTVFDDFEKGIITPEGLRAAKTFLPEAFVEFQLDLQKQVTDRMMRGQKLTQSQRLRVDKLLGYGLLRPASAARLQANLNAPKGATPAPPTGNGPVNMQVQQSGFDAIEARMTG